MIKHVFGKLLIKSAPNSFSDYMYTHLLEIGIRFHITSYERVYTNIHTRMQAILSTVLQGSTYFTATTAMPTSSSSVTLHIESNANGQ